MPKWGSSIGVFLFEGRQISGGVVEKRTLYNPRILLDQNQIVSPIQELRVKGDTHDVV